jgi:hypothetical protein
MIRVNPKVKSAFGRTKEGVSSLINPIKDRIKSLENKTAIIIAPALLALTKLPEKVLADVGSFSIGGLVGELIGKKLVISKELKDFLVIGGIFSGIAALGTLRIDNVSTYILAGISGLLSGVSLGSTRR